MRRAPQLLLLLLLLLLLCRKGSIGAGSVAHGLLA
jgi:hypothetical protein